MSCPGVCQYNASHQQTSPIVKLLVHLFNRYTRRLDQSNCEAISSTDIGLRWVDHETYRPSLMRRWVLAIGFDQWLHNKVFNDRKTVK